MCFYAIFCTFLRVFLRVFCVLFDDFSTTFHRSNCPVQSIFCIFSHTVFVPSADCQSCLGLVSCRTRPIVNEPSSTSRVTVVPAAINA